LETIFSNLIQHLNDIFSLSDGTLKWKYFNELQNVSVYLSLICFNDSSTSQVFVKLDDHVHQHDLAW